MFVRVVRFTDVTAERVESLVARIDETGPPPGRADQEAPTGLRRSAGHSRRPAVLRQRGDLRAGAETFAAMDPSETPGRRVSVDTGELKVEREL